MSILTNVHAVFCRKLNLAASIILLSVTPRIATGAKPRAQVTHAATHAVATCEQASPAIDAYHTLMQRAPHLFSSVGDWRQGEITILTDPRLMCEAQEQMRGRYAAKNGAAYAYEASRTGVVLEDPYIIMLREAVRFPNGKLGLYNRKITRATVDGGVAGAFCLPLLADGRVVMVKEYRHQERRWRLSVPGGFRDEGETSEQAGRREATEETGYALQQLHLLGTLDAEGEDVPLYIAAVKGDVSSRSPDEGEALAGIIAVTLDELKQAILASHYRDAQGHVLGLQAHLGTTVLLAENFLKKYLQLPKGP